MLNNFNILILMLIICNSNTYMLHWLELIKNACKKNTNINIYTFCFFN